MSAAGQLPLALPHRPALGRADFLVGASNEAAVAWLDRWPAWPGGTLVLLGPPAGGKSHLAAVWAARSGARILDGPALTAPAVAELVAHAPPALAVEDADGASEPEALLHLRNSVIEAGGTLLVTARTAPQSWAAALPDLASRLAGAGRARVDSPSDDLLAGVLVKQLADRQLTADRRAVAYALKRMPRSFAAARDLAAAADRLSLAEKRPVTTAVMRRALAALGD